MIGILVTILIILAIVAILGVVIEGLFWLTVIAIVLILAAAAWGWIKRKARR